MVDWDRTLRAITTAQAKGRAFIAMKRYKRLKIAVVVIQRTWRKWKKGINLRESMRAEVENLLHFSLFVNEIVN